VFSSFFSSLNIEYVTNPKVSRFTKNQQNSNKTATATKQQQQQNSNSNKTATATTWVANV